MSTDGCAVDGRCARGSIPLIDHPGRYSRTPLRTRLPSWQWTDRSMRSDVREDGRRACGERFEDGVRRALEVAQRDEQAGAFDDWPDLVRMARETHAIDDAEQGTTSRSQRGSRWRRT